MVEPELLDELPQNDPRAVQSRRDLRRINFFMGNVGIAARMLRKSFPTQSPKRIVELGAGDGTFMLQLARKFSPRWSHVEIVLVDQQNLVSPETLAELETLGWRVTIIAADVFVWLATCEPSDCMLANLFLHHFNDDQLAELLKLAADKTRAFIACEPRRFSGGILGTSLLWMIGCNDVTRHDAAVSVRAGFQADELTKLWPHRAEWKIEEGEAGLFSHAFVAALARAWR